MKTLYAACLSRLGLSQAEAAVLHNVALQSVKNWCAGRSRPPQGAWAELRAQEMRIVDASEAMREGWEDTGALPIRPRENNDAGRLPLMAAADFLLGCDAEIEY